MTHRTSNRALALLMVCLLLCSALCVPVAAQESVLSIGTREEWLAFAENCRTDAYSKGLSVRLTADIDLSGAEKPVVPVFCGSFDGAGHSVTGFVLDTESDDQGLFRYLTQEAVVRGLRLEASVTGRGEASGIGGICGSNRGLIENCAVSGDVSGYEQVGGVAGVNEAEGRIKDSSSSAVLAGTYQTGGIAGSNAGSIESCQNTGDINLEANGSATNTGGIAGVNEGVILRCSNAADVGYLHTGYNVGGIAGRNNGFVNGGVNSGNILGRRDVGGIAGQMEPSFQLEYAQSAMALLDESVSDFTGRLNGTASALQGMIEDGAAGLQDIFSDLSAFSQGLSGDVDALFQNMTWKEEVQAARDAILAELENIRDSLPDPSAVAGLLREIETLLGRFESAPPLEWLRLVRELSGKLSELSALLQGFDLPAGSLERLAAGFADLSSAVVNGLHQFGEGSAGVLENASSSLAALTQGIDAFLKDASSASSELRTEVSGLSGTLAELHKRVEDVLAGREETVEDLSELVERQADGMIVSAGNTGKVSGDYNIGGVVGNLSVELSLDQEETSLPTADELLFSDVTLYVKATVYACENAGEISAKYDCAGGIIGYGRRGAVIENRNAGNISAGERYAGGVAGNFLGTVRGCLSLSLVAASSYAGGIAGQAKQVEDCAAVPWIESDGAYVGAIAGALTGSGARNVFVHEKLGGVDNISCEGIATPVDYQTLMAQETPPELFRTVTLRFEVDGAVWKEITLPYGEGLNELPAGPEQEGKYWTWETFDADCVRYSRTVGGSWSNLIATISTGEEKPLFLAEGAFLPGVRLEAVENAGAGDACPGLTLLAAYELHVSDPACERMVVRFLTEEEGEIYVPTAQGLQPIPHRRDGSYIVFELENGQSFLYAAKEEADRLAPMLVAAGGILLAVGCVLLWYRVGRRRRSRG